jgi:hypothetical protein
MSELGNGPRGVSEGGRSPDRRHTTRRRRVQPLQAAVRPTVVIVDSPLVENAPRLRQAQEQFSVEQLVAESSVEALHVAVLPRACLLDGERADTCPRQPLPDLLGNELGPVVAA